MNRTLFILSLQSILFNIQAQEFSFQLFFEDAVGNKDTITLGYDKSATNDIDTSFGEVNIIYEEIVKPFDVQISDEWHFRSNGLPGNFHTKKQILHYACIDYYDGVQGIDIFSKHWPVNVRWDNTLFDPQCRNGSLITCHHPGAWWDAGCPIGSFIQLMKWDGMLSFDSNNQGSIINTNYGYINEFNDTIAFYFFVFGPPGVSNVAVEDEFKTAERIKVSPNPVVDKLSLHIPEDLGNLESLQILSLEGQTLLRSNNIMDIDLSNLSSGIYLIQVQMELGHKAIAKFIRR